MVDFGWIGSLAAILVLAAGAMAAAPVVGGGSRAGVLSTLRRGHPRLFLTKERMAEMRAALRTDPEMKRLFDRILRAADRTMGEEPVEFKLVGPRLLSVSRRCLDRVSTLGLVYTVTGDRKYADRAWREMRAAAAFRDWNPSHFLDTAEMTAALGIGYDWLYETGSPEDRAAVRQAIVGKGLKPGLECYRGKARYGWWVQSRFNWNQVCNGGLAQGALAVADEEPAIAAEILESGLKSAPAAMASFGIDGGWAEGPGYWGYTMMYASRYLDALQTALGTMHGLEQTPGLAEAGLFRIYLVGPTGEYFNFADAGPNVGESSAMFWLARTFDRPVYAWHERQRIRDDPFNAVWYTPEGKSPAASGLPLSKHFRGVGVVIFRSDWDSPDAFWIGLKAGDNKANHSNLDLGTFVLEALGQRWAIDLGPDDYNLPGYFGAKRWTYYRLRTEGQNTLVVDGQSQDTQAGARIVAFQADARAAGAVADLSAGYPMAKSVQRGITMVGGRAIVQDEIAAPQPVDVVWGMHTRAKVTAEKDRAVLEQGGKTLGMRILEPAGAVFAVLDANPPPPERQQPDVHKLIVRLPEKTRQVRIAVEFIPAGAGAAKATPVKPLGEWAGWFAG